MPGLAKTLTVSTLAQVMGGTFARLQFTPDLVPADIVGTRIWRPSREEFDIEWGPVFANIVLVDEINRAPAKVQSALLEVMAERQVSIGGQSRSIPNPFLVMATQNPIESEGVYALPEAQRDRFMMQIIVNQPSYEEETEIARRMGVRPPEAEQVLSTEQLIALQSVVDDVFVHHAVQDYAVRLVMATRDPARWGLDELGAHIALGRQPQSDPRSAVGRTGARRPAGPAVPRSPGHLRRGARGAVPPDAVDLRRVWPRACRVDDIVARILSHRPGSPGRSPSGRAEWRGDVARPAVRPGPTRRVPAGPPARSSRPRHESGAHRPAATGRADSLDASGDRPAVGTHRPRWRPRPPSSDGSSSTSPAGSTA